MKAITYERYGPPEVLELREVPKPEVKDDGLLIRVHAASVNRSDWEALTARPFYVRLGGTGFRRPKQPFLGSDIAGTIEAVGRDVTEFEPGQEVLADILWHSRGGFAEYVTVTERAPIVLKPPGVTFEQAAAIPQAAVLALQGLRGTELGQRVLVNGAGGGAGSFAVQLAKSYGAEVTGVDSGLKLDLMRSIGADHVIDYKRQNFTRGGRRYDRILDFVGRRSTFAHRRALGPGGTYGMVGGSMPRLIQTFVVGGLISKMSSKQIGVVLAKPTKEDLAHLAGRVAAGELTPVIERTYPLAEAPEALGHLGDGRALGKLVITM